MSSIVTEIAGESRKDQKPTTVLLAGNPNVGKSVIFNYLTGIGVTVSNYPGTTVEITEGKVRFSGRTILVKDLPGIYSIIAATMDQMVARRAILEEKNAIVVNIIDASNLQRNLNLTLQILELEVPLVIVLNMLDEAHKRGIEVNHGKLSEILGVPVIPAVATRGEGIKEAIEVALQIVDKKRNLKPMKVQYGKDVEDLIDQLKKALETNATEKPYGMPYRALAIRLLEGDSELVNKLMKSEKHLIELAEDLAKTIEKQHDETAILRIAKESHGIANSIAEAVMLRRDEKILLKDKLSEITTNPYTGILVMFGVWVGLFALLLYGGSFLEQYIVAGWNAFLAPALQQFFGLLPSPFGDIIGRGVILGLEAGVAVVIPYVGLFYIALAILEDTGYLTRMAYLMDNMMHRLGLHGRSIIPIIAGYGCSVPAIMGTRILETRREKIIASFLITLVPCSARTVVILGIVGQYLGLIPVLLIYAFDIGIVAIAGLVLNKIMKGESLGLVMEMPPFRAPYPRPILKKTWIRLKEFIYMAFPLLIAGSLVLSSMEFFGVLGPAASLLSPVTVGLLGLPLLSGVALLFGVLRKEMALGMLVVVFGTTNFALVMTPVQMVVFTVVLILYIPCVAAIAVLGRELGWRNALIIGASTVIIAFMLGGLVNTVLLSLGFQ
ncbi:MAG: ferrous iron transport protein B [Candidatus Hodarchaeota archaeon]